MSNIDLKNLTEQERKAYYDDKTIDYTIIVSQDSKKSLGSSTIGTVLNMLITLMVGVSFPTGRKKIGLVIV